ncbi:hypothetical protein BGZ68_005479 [Mortierella alpina]|nr:hypothetical protein BGZ68_005479 [Mortierella alpina]
MDEWRWEWLIPVTKHGARPESFEGAMATTNTAKSIASVFGKLKAGTKDRPEIKEKNLHAVGDFVLGTQHDEYMRDSIKKAQQAATAAAAAAALTTGPDDDHNDVRHTTLLSGQHRKTCDGLDSTGETRPKAPSGIPEPIPFLVRKVIKLHFSRPPQGSSSRAGYFLPPPSMALPTLPSTRRLKAIIPGAKIQVQIQVPSIIPIPGYAQTSLLVPSSKTGGLVSKAKRCDGGGDPGLLGTGTAFRDQYIGHHAGKDAKMNRLPSRLDPRYPDNFQVALTIRKVTKHDINKSDILRRRYENAEVEAKTLAKHTNSCNAEESGSQGLPRTRLLSGTCTKFTQPKSAYTPGWGTLPCERKRDDGATCTNLDCKRKDEVLETASKVCRREIRVRKIKCEFWQKESCRIPTDEAPSRSVKLPLAPVFIYSEKEQEKERMGGMAAYHQNSAYRGPFDSTDVRPSKLAPPQGLAMSTTHNCYDDAGLSTPISPAAKNITATDCSHTPSPLKPPPPFNAGERKGSLGSIFSTSLQRSACSSPAIRPTSVVLTSSSTSPSPATNHPFMLLIPVPLNSPNLRQTYDWPSSEMPSPILPSAYDYAMPGSLISETGLGLGSELDSTSQATTQDAGETVSFGVDGYISPTLPNTSAVKARIVVKHHLSFRLSIDVLEYEGEYEQEDMDLEAIEEQQLQRARSRQAISVGSHSGSIANFDLGLSDLKGSCSTPEETTGCRGGAEEQHATAADVKFASGISIPPFERTGVNISHGNSDQPHLQPALSFFNSAAGLLDLDEDDGHPLQEPALLGLSCALPAQRRGSQGSLGTVRSNYSSNSGTATSASLMRAQTCNSVSGASSGGSSVLYPLADVSSGSGGGGGSGGLMAGAIGVLKKKASFSGLASALGTTSTSIATHHLQPRQQPSQASISQNRAVVRKLKDFVIRVPITVVIQVDEQGRAAGAYGTTGSCSNVPCENVDLGQGDGANTLLRQSNVAHEDVSVPASSSASHWRGGFWREQESDQLRVNLENADEDFDEDFIVVDAEEVD